MFKNTFEPLFDAKVYNQECILSLIQFIHLYSTVTFHLS